jgi:hypothetical protein
MSALEAVAFADIALKFQGKEVIDKCSLMLDQKGRIKSIIVEL